MGYVSGFVAAVPVEKKDDYLRMASRTAQIFRDHGASRVVETWEDNVPDGKVTDFRRAVLAKPGEAIVFSWIEFPSRAAADAGFAAAMADPRMAGLGAMPFDGKRMIFGGFSKILET